MPTELVWDGKHKDGKKSSPLRISLPFQDVETVNESTEKWREYTCCVKYRPPTDTISGTR